MIIKNGKAYAENLNDITAINLAKHLTIVTFHETGHEQLIAATKTGFTVQFASSLPNPACREYTSLRLAKKSLTLC
jgi:hypothetical protein